MSNNIIWILVLGAIVGFTLFQNKQRQKMISETDFSDAVFIDVRTPQEFNGGTITDAHNFPVQTLSQRLSELEQLTQGKESKIVVFCRSGNRSAKAKSILEGAGFSQIIDIGAITNYPK